MKALINNKTVLTFALAALVVLFAVIIIAMLFSPNGIALAAEENTGSTSNVPSETSNKAYAAALVMGLAAVAGAIAMGMAISKSNEGISRQPEAAGKIRASLMLGLVFIETVIIYALIVSILIIFVL